MKEIDISTLEQSINIRQIGIGDYNELVELQHRSFPGMKPWTLKQLQSQLALFHEGQLCIEYN